MDLLIVSDVAGFADGEQAELLTRWANAKVRRVAPCFQGQPSDDVIAEARAIVLGALERTAETEGWVQSWTEGPRSVTYRHLEASVLFSPAEEAELRSLCGASVVSGLPSGSFPRPAQIGHLFERRVR